VHFHRSSKRVKKGLAVGVPFRHKCDAPEVFLEGNFILISA
jgi:hypothetical protein